MSDLDKAYALETPEDNRRLYAGWAGTYDSDFARDMQYQLPGHVARAFAEAGGVGPVLDLGAGTGLLGEALAARGIAPVDATDLSPEMLQVARGKGVYRALFPGNLLERLPCPEGAYAGAVSSGTFTNGHVGPEALPEVLRVVRTGGLIVLSVNARHYAAKGFEADLRRLGPALGGCLLTEVPIYGAGATGPHAGDTALLLNLRKL